MVEIRHAAASHISHRKSVILKMRKWNNFALIRWSQKQSSRTPDSVRGSPPQTESILLCGCCCWVSWLLYWLFWHVTCHQETPLFHSWSLSTTRSGCQMRKPLSQQCREVYSLFPPVKPGILKSLKIGCFILKQVMKPVEAKFATGTIKVN